MEKKQNYTIPIIVMILLFGKVPLVSSPTSSPMR